MVGRSRAAKTDKRRMTRLFGSLQRKLQTDLKVGTDNLDHPGAQGQSTKLNWRKMLTDHLPTRYQVAKAFVIDASGRRSDEIDAVIYDRQYSPLLLNEAGSLYIPAESVYAAFEIKPRLSGPVLTYAADKAGSVRRLRRTSVSITHAGGTSDAREPFKILAGVLCAGSAWRRSLTTALPERLRLLSGDRELDLGCCLVSGGFDVDYTVPIGPRVDVSAQGTALVFFFLRLLERLQGLGTVPAMDLHAYTGRLKVTRVDL